MLISADRFSALPEGCPVLNDYDAPATIIGTPGKICQGVALYPIRFIDVEDTEWPESRLRVDLTTPAAVRAFAPALIVAVKGLQNAPKHPPGVAWEKEFGTDAKPRYVLVWSVEIYDNDWRVTKGPLFFSPTPEACLLNGLKAALDAAKDAQ